MVLKVAQLTIDITWQHFCGCFQKPIDNKVNICIYFRLGQPQTGGLIATGYGVL